MRQRKKNELSKIWHLTLARSSLVPWRLSPMPGEMHWAFWRCFVTIHEWANKEKTSIWGHTKKQSHREERELYTKHTEAEKTQEKRATHRPSYKQRRRKKSIHWRGLRVERWRKTLLKVGNWCRKTSLSLFSRGEKETKNHHENPNDTKCWLCLTDDFDYGWLKDDVLGFIFHIPSAVCWPRFTQVESHRLVVRQRRVGTEMIWTLILHYNTKECGNV